MPSAVTATLVNGTTRNLAVIWNKIADTTKSGTYTFIGTIRMVNGIVNTRNITVPATLVVNGAKTFRRGETATIHDTLWGTYELTINSISFTDERNEYDNTKPAEVYKINYTYKLLSKGSCTEMGLWIDGFSNYADSTGEMGGNYPDSVVNYPKELVNVGNFCTAEAFVGVNNPTTKLTITQEYYTSTGNDSVTFIIPTK